MPYRWVSIVKVAGAFGKLTEPILVLSLHPNPLVEDLRFSVVGPPNGAELFHP
jgi:hypothetical protein